MKLFKEDLRASRETYLRRLGAWLGVPGAAFLSLETLVEEIQVAVRRRR